MPSLVVPRADVAQKLHKRIELGSRLLNSEITSEAQLDKVESERTKWHSYNKEYLARSFDVPSISESYSRVSGLGALMMNFSLGQLIQSFSDGIDNQIIELESICERLELIPEPSMVSQFEPTQIINNNNSVFIVQCSFGIRLFL